MGKENSYFLKNRKMMPIANIPIRGNRGDWGVAVGVWGSDTANAAGTVGLEVTE